MGSSRRPYGSQRTSILESPTGSGDKVRLGYECMVNGRFYMQLGVDLEKAISDGIQVAIDLYGDR